ncbi:MAG: SIS domain-containing protein [Pseudomonadota bacterium]
MPDLDFSQIERITLVACGTAHYACQLANTWIKESADLPVEIEIASEYRYAKRITVHGELFVAVSQSGETADTLAAIKTVRGRVAYRLAIVNVATSSIAREAKQIIDITAGPEIGVASAKAFTVQPLALFALPLRAGDERSYLQTRR